MESKRRDHLLTLLFLLLTLALFLLPSWKQAPDSAERVKVRVLSTDNSNMRQFGIVRTGDQGLRIRILEGSFRGTETDAVNHLAGRLELDKVFVPGDLAFAVVDADAGRIAKASVLDHYRLDTQLRLLALFCALLLLFGGWTGARALLSFFFTGAMIWKVLLPGYLAGLDPVLISLFTALALTAAIVFLWWGGEPERAGGVSGVDAGHPAHLRPLALLRREFRIHGAVKPFSETLLYSGFAHLDLTRIFLGGIFLASSGAVMDLAMDVASAMREIVEKKPDISRKDADFVGIHRGPRGGQER